MNPAQKALQDKLARMRAAKNVGDSQGNVASSAPVEVKQEPEVQKVSEPKEQSVQLPVAEKVPETVPTREEPASTQQQHANQEESKGKTTEVDHPIKMQLAELAQALEEKQPGFKTILRDIHTKLRQDPAIVTLLSDEEIGGILAGLKHHAQVEIIAPKEKKTSAKEAKAKATNMTADDL